MSAKLVVGETDISFVVRQMPTRRVRVESVVMCYGSVFAYKQDGKTRVVYTDDYARVKNLVAYARGDLIKMGYRGLCEAVVQFGIIDKGQLLRSQWWFTYNDARERRLLDLEEAQELLLLPAMTKEKLQDMAMAYALQHANKSTGLNVTLADLQ